MPHSFGALTPPARWEWHEKLGAIVDTMTQQVMPNLSGTFVIEWPTFMPDSRKGWTAAQRGGLVKLSAIAGALLASYWRWDVHMITPADWKGQLPKKFAHRELRKSLTKKVREEMEQMPDHTWDAVAIGVWFLEGQP